MFLKKSDMYRTKVLLIVLSAILISSPFLIWGNNYLVGGDDTRLYYIYPLEFIKNYAVNIASDNTLAGAMTGYASVAYYIPFFTLIYLLKLLPLINVQMLLYGMNLLLGFLGFYKFVGLYMDHEKTEGKTISIIGALLYIFSPYLTKTHYSHQMLTMYLVSTLPVCLYLFILSVRKKTYFYSGLVVLIFSIFSTGLNTFPWWSGFLITTLPILFFEFVSNKKSFIKNLIFVFLGYLFLNSYWIFHYIYPFLDRQNVNIISQNYNSEVFVNDNIRIVRGVSRLISPINIIINKMEYDISFVKIGLVDFIPFIILIFGMVLSLVESKKNKLLFNLLISGFVLSWFLLSPNLGEWGPRLFLFLSRRIPYFTMYRNMHDKFSISLAMYTALLSCMSLGFIYRKHSKLFKYILYISAIYILIVLCPNYYLVSKNITKTYTVFNGRFNFDFNELISYLKNSSDHSKILWLPLNSPTYLNISGENQNQFYSGLSPIKILTGKTDYTGRFSFIVGNDFFLGDGVFNMLKNNDYTGFGEQLKKLNITNIIVSKETPPDNYLSFLYGGDDLSVLKMQESNEFKNEILGSRVKDFGDKYTLYKINPKYMSYKWYSKGNGTVFPLSYNKINSEKYIIDLNKDRSGDIVFSELSSEYWNLSFNGNKLNKIPSDEYHNVWSGDIIPQGEQKLVVEYKPKKWNAYFVDVSAVALIIILFIIVNYLYHNYLNKKSILSQK